MRRASGVPGRHAARDAILLIGGSVRRFRLAWALAVAFLGFAIPVRAVPIVDCPLRAQPYSVDSPLIDILLKSEARAVVERESPGLLQGVASTSATIPTPSIVSILTVRIVAGFKRVGPAVLTRINRSLAVLPVTRADQQARCARYDDDRSDPIIPHGRPRILLFEKMTGFRDGPSVEAARTALQAMAARRGWTMVVTDRAGTLRPAILARFDAVIWNNVSGDVLTLRQRRAFRAYIEGGGGFVGIHGAGGDFVYYWDWYADTLLGARFIGHPLNPQFQDARIVVENQRSGIGRDLAPGWTMKDEWYSFANNPRARGAHVVATLEEASYSPKGIAGQDLRMGEHPIAWYRCVGNGRSFYSAIGHRPESYSEPHHLKLLEDAVAWAIGSGETRCRRGAEVAG